MWMLRSPQAMVLLGISGRVWSRSNMGLVGVILESVEGGRYIVERVKEVLLGRVISIVVASRKGEVKFRSGVGRTE